MIALSPLPTSSLFSPPEPSNYLESPHLSSGCMYPPNNNVPRSMGYFSGANQADISQFIGQSQQRKNFDVQPTRDNYTLSQTGPYDYNSVQYDDVGVSWPDFSVQDFSDEITQVQEFPSSQDTTAASSFPVIHWDNRDYTPPSNVGQFPQPVNYAPPIQRSPHLHPQGSPQVYPVPIQQQQSHRRGSRSTEVVPSPHLMPHVDLPLARANSQSVGSSPYHVPADIPSMHEHQMIPSPPFIQVASQLTPSPTTPNFYSGTSAEDNMERHREQLRLWMEAVKLPMATLTGPFIPQKMYIPHTNSDRRRYVEEIDLAPPIYFWVQDPEECGIPLVEALHSRVRRLMARDEPVFEGRGPSISVRIQWPGYRPWSRQIPTKDFRSPPGPITRAKLAKNVAKCVERFLNASADKPLEDDVSRQWKVGPRPNEIKLEDLILVSMHHVSMGSWQPHLRLRHPFTVPA